MRDDRIGRGSDDAELGPDRLHMRIHGAVEGSARIVPRSLHQLIAAEHPSGLREQRAQQPVLVARKLERPSAVGDAAPGLVVLPG